MNGNGKGEFWLKVIGMLGAAVLVVSTWVWGASTLYVEVDNIKKNSPPPGSITVIQDHIERQGEQIKNIEHILELQAQDRRDMMDFMRAQGAKVDRVLERWDHERGDKAR